MTDSPLITARMREHIRRKKPLALLAEVDHPDGLVRVWSKTGTLQYDGHAWQGLGVLGKVSPVGTTRSLMIREVKFELAGVPQAALDFLDANVRNRIAALWMAGVLPRQKIVGDPFQIQEARLDYQTYAVDDDGRAKIALIGQVGFFTLERAVDIAWSTEEQIKLYPGDTGLDLVPSLANKDILWRPS